MLSFCFLIDCLQWSPFRMAIGQCAVVVRHRSVGPRAPVDLHAPAKHLSIFVSAHWSGNSNAPAPRVDPIARQRRVGHSFAFFLACVLRDSATASQLPPKSTQPAPEQPAAKSKARPSRFYCFSFSGSCWHSSLLLFQVSPRHPPPCPQIGENRKLSPPCRRSGGRKQSQYD